MTSSLPLPTKESDKIDAIIRYALIAASREDDVFSRELGPLHFIKYVYIVDLEFAKYNNGETFTGIQWEFFRFGPWSQVVNARIEPALSLPSITQEKRQSNFGSDDYLRWYINDPEGLEMSFKLPLPVRGAIEKYVHQFRNDTSSLLHFIYATPPMLKAAPNEILDFSVMSKKTEKKNNTPDTFTPLLERLSNSKKKQLRSRMSNLQKAFQARLKKQEEKKELDVHYSEHDSVYEKGMQWLSDLSGPDFPAEKVDVTIANTVWKSESRRGE